jgi:hypothetical protein
MMNNPLSYIDPDGRNPVMIGFMVGLFTGAAKHMIKSTMPKNMWDFVKPGIVGAVGGYFGAVAPNPIKVGLGQSIGYGIFSGGVTGGISDALNGGNGSGALWGAVTGGVMGGIGFGLADWGVKLQLHNTETAMAQGDPPKGSKQNPFLWNITASVTALKRLPPPSAIPWGHWLGTLGKGAVRTVGWFATLATSVEGDASKKPIRYTTMYRNMSEAEYSSFMRKGGNFGFGVNTLDHSKQFWMTPDGLAFWNSKSLSGPYNVAITMPTAVITPYGLVQQQILDGHLAGIVYPNNINSFNQVKIVVSITKR